MSYCHMFSIYQFSSDEIFNFYSCKNLHNFIEWASFRNGMHLQNLYKHQNTSTVLKMIHIAFLEKVQVFVEKYRLFIGF